MCTYDLVGETQVARHVAAAAARQKSRPGGQSMQLGFQPFFEKATSCFPSASTKRPRNWVGAASLPPLAIGVWTWFRLYVYIYIYIMHMHICMIYIYIHILYTYIYVIYIYIYIYTHVYAYIYIYIRVCIYIYIYI